MGIWVFDPGAVRSASARLASEQVAEHRWERPDWERALPTAGLQEDAVWLDVRTAALHDRLSSDARSIAAFAFTGILNNAIDHSRADGQGSHLALSL